MRDPYQLNGAAKDRGDRGNGEVRCFPAVENHQKEVVGKRDKRKKRKEKRRLIKEKEKQKKKGVAKESQRYKIRIKEQGKNKIKNKYSTLKIIL